MKKRDSHDEKGAVVVTCYRIFNKKADGTCGKKMKFTSNQYHTTSQWLVNGSKVEVFVSDIYNNLCTLMKARCKELDILNTNIASAINKAMYTESQTLEAKAIEHNVATGEQEAELNQSRDELSDEEVCELCPICRKQAYGRTVLCGECGEWYHLECVKADENTLQALADDDFICGLCTDNLLYENNNQDNTVRDTEQLSQSNNETLDNTDSSPIIIDMHNQSNEQSVNSGLHTQTSNENINVAPVKAKVKKSAKLNKVKKEEVPDKSYILEVESQVGMLKSTTDLYKKRNDLLMNQTRSTDTHEHIGPETNTSEQACRHKCCTELAEKLQDNRLRLLETQVMQNMYISNAMHIQLVSQMRSSYHLPAMQYDPVTHGYNSFYGQPPIIWNPTPLPSMPQGLFQPCGFTPLVRPPAYIPTQTRPPFQPMHGVTPLYPHHTGPGSNTRQVFSGIIQPGHIGTSHPGLSNVRLPLYQQHPGLQHIQPVQPHIQPLNAQGAIGQGTTQPGYVRSSQPSYINVRPPSYQPLEAQPPPNVQSAPTKEVLPNTQQSACRAQTIPERPKPVDRLDTSTRDYDTYISPSSNFSAKANSQPVRRRHMLMTTQ